MQVLASQSHFLANRNAELAIPPLFWPVNCIKIGGHVALLSDPTVHSEYYELADKLQQAGKIDNSQQVCAVLGCVHRRAKHRREA